MAKSCRFCGAEMADNAIKCPECQKTVPGAEIIIDKEHQKKKKFRITLITVITVIVLLLGVVIASIVSKNQKAGSNTYYGPIDMNLSAMLENSPKKYLNCYPEFMRTDIQDTLGYLSDDNFEQYMSLLNDEIIKIYGSNVAVSYEITNTQHWDTETSQEYLESVFEYITDYNIEDFSVQDGYQLELSITLKGSIGTQTMSTNVAVMQFNNSWYLMNIINPISNEVDTNTY